MIDGKRLEDLYHDTVSIGGSNKIKKGMIGLSKTSTRQFHEWPKQIRKC